GDPRRSRHAGCTPTRPGSPAEDPPARRGRCRRRQRLPGERAVDVHHQDGGHQRDAAADRRADRLRLPDRARRGARHRRRRGAADHREEVADPGHRRHPLPAALRLRRHRRRLRRRARQPRQHQEVRRQ
ncbi:MAG: (E)-4-hydroxy-3-methylbut-2-enyl-diphosphate synthase (flavodoxin), partial [uncultured Blastococcus sp.]